MEPLLVTGIGSLPHRDPVAAVAFVSRFAPRAPFWPQLPRFAPGESMLAQVARGAPAWSEQNASGLGAFERGAKRGLFKDALIVKGQIVGPVTLATAEGKGVLEHGALVEASERVARLARSQIERLAALGRPVVVFVDEPSLGTLPQSALHADADAALHAVTTVLDAIRDAGAAAGIHCCAPPPLAELELLDPDVFSFDADLYLDQVIADARVARWLGGDEHVLAVGIVPPLRPCDDDELFRRALKIPRSWLAQTWITPSCGIASGSIAAAESVFDRAITLAERLRGELP